MLHEVHVAISYLIYIGRFLSNPTLLYNLKLSKAYNICYVHTAIISRYSFILLFIWMSFANFPHTSVVLSECHHFNTAY